MGTAASLLGNMGEFSVWTEEEKAANEKCLIMYQDVTEFAGKFFFTDVLVRRFELSVLQNLCIFAQFNLLMFFFLS